ncbi:hypothetical protein ES707_08087 [subsurface metagenome]
MARLKRPLFGDSATGSIGRSISYVRSPGFPSCRHKYYHKTTRTEPQDIRRMLFSRGKEAWKSLSQKDKYDWNAYATPPLNGYNAFLHYYLSGLPKPDFPRYFILTLPSPAIADLTPHILPVTLSSLVYEKEDIIMAILSGPQLTTMEHILVGEMKLYPPDATVVPAQFEPENVLYPAMSITLSEVP